MNFYDLSHDLPSGQAFPMNQLSGKVVLIVNTATKCGLTPQFSGLEELHQQYNDQGLVVLGFPCDQFMGQEPETDDSMEQVCRVNHGVTFQLMAKSDVNGSKTNDVFRFLKKQLGGLFGSRIKWNFTKFLVDSEGNPIKRYSPTTKPESIEADIKKLIMNLAQPA
ncbi:MAG: glutathione peroxidase [Flavobacteriales bacterium]|nr:glutathione peroxidase [Flavobacteriales bacterium]